MNDEQLELICKAFQLNNNSSELSTKSFHIMNESNYFRFCFTINNKLLIYKTKGKREKLIIDKRIDIEKLMNEIQEKINILENLK